MFSTGRKEFSTMGSKNDAMRIIRDPAEVQRIAQSWKADGLRVGLVPTMGFLHDGHRSLIHRAVAENDRVVVSDFVNPIQFGPTEDLKTYPRDLDADAALCREEGVDILFCPAPEDMYRTGFQTHVEVEEITRVLEGAARPTHFRGVTTVVLKLFHIAKADRAYFGEKDAQQLAVIRRMVMDLNVDIEICGCPIVREADGLAKSSRNTYLSPEERTAAVCLNRALTQARKLLEDGERDAGTIRRVIREGIEAEPLAVIDDISVVDLETLQDVNGTIDRSILVPIAVKIGKTRLIDNFSFRI